MQFWKPKQNKKLKINFGLKVVKPFRGVTARKPFKDSDKDKVIDIFDCKPFNKKRQGVEHESSIMNGAEFEETRPCAGCGKPIRGHDTEYCATCRKGGLPRRKSKRRYEDEDEDYGDYD